MRKITEEEQARWTALAREYGLIDESGWFPLDWIEPLGREVDGREVHVRGKLVTPLRAHAYSENLSTKTPPIRFDRTPTGEIILPGRWWQEIVEHRGRNPQKPVAFRQASARAARVCLFRDILLPPDTDTIEIVWPDDDGNPVTYEALPPGTCVTVMISGPES